MGKILNKEQGNVLGHEARPPTWTGSRPLPALLCPILPDGSPATLPAAAD